MRTATVIKMLQMLFTKYAAKEILDACAARGWKITQGLFQKSLNILWKLSHSNNSWLDLLIFLRQCCAGDSLLGSLPMGRGDVPNQARCLLEGCSLAPPLQKLREKGFIPFVGGQRKWAGCAIPDLHFILGFPSTTGPYLTFFWAKFTICNRDCDSGVRRSWN